MVNGVGPYISTKVLGSNLLPDLTIYRECDGLNRAASVNHQCVGVKVSVAIARRASLVSVQSKSFIAFSAGVDIL